MSFWTKLANEWTHYGGFQDSLVDVLSPGHVVGELIFVLIFDVFIGILAWPRIKRGIRKHDQEHHSAG